MCSVVINERICYPTTPRKKINKRVQIHVLLNTLFQFPKAQLTTLRFRDKQYAKCRVIKILSLERQIATSLAFLLTIPVKKVIVCHRKEEFVGHTGTIVFAW